MTPKEKRSRDVSFAAYETANARAKAANLPGQVFRTYIRVASRDCEPIYNLEVEIIPMLGRKPNGKSGTIVMSFASQREALIAKDALGFSMDCVS